MRLKNVIDMDVKVCVYTSNSVHLIDYNYIKNFPKYYLKKKVKKIKIYNPQTPSARNSWIEIYI
jgi:hypothetical protein